MNRKITLERSFLFILLLCSSLYMGLLVSLHFIWYPDWALINDSNIDYIFNAPLDRAVGIFKPIVIIMLTISVLLLIVTKKGITKLLSVFQLILTATFAFISIKYILPLNDELKLTLQDAHLQSVVKKWMRFNDYRTLIIMCIWIFTVFMGCLSEKVQDKIFQ